MWHSEFLLSSVTAYQERWIELECKEAMQVSAASILIDTAVLNRIRFLCSLTNTYNGLGTAERETECYRMRGLFVLSFFTMCSLLAGA